jgi:nitrite reductase (NADH) large subunit
MLLAAQSRDKAVVIGGGLLGPGSRRPERTRHGRDRAACHADADGAPARPAAGYLLQNSWNAGHQVRTKANTKQIVGNGKVEGVELDTGEIIPATLVVMAVGIRPNTASPRTPGWRSIAASSPTIRWSRRPRHFFARRMRRGRRSCLWPGRAAL